MDSHSLTPSLAGIVMAGGQSRRMGTDKSMLKREGVPMYLYAARLLQLFTSEVYISVNKYQAEHNTYLFPVLMDQFESEGPIAALVSCHQHLNKPLLILACDMPAVTATMMDSLINLHKPELMTTMFCTPEKGLYEPMLSIWQETALDALAAFFLSGGRSFQTYLSSCNIPKNPLPSASTLINCNTPEDWQKWKLNAF